MLQPVIYMGIKWRGKDRITEAASYLAESIMLYMGIKGRGNEALPEITGGVRQAPPASTLYMGIWGWRKEISSYATVMAPGKTGDFTKSVIYGRAEDVAEDARLLWPCNITP